MGFVPSKRIGQEPREKDALLFLPLLFTRKQASTPRLGPPPLPFVCILPICVPLSQHAKRSIFLVCPRSALVGEAQKSVLSLMLDLKRLSYIDWTASLIRSMCMRRCFKDWRVGAAEVCMGVRREVAAWLAFVCEALPLLRVWEKRIHPSVPSNCSAGCPRNMGAVAYLVV